MLKHAFISISIIALMATSVISQPARAQNLITNGGFETGDFAGWTATPSGSTSFFGVDATGPVHDGTYSAFFGGVGPIGDTISQSFATVLGQTYAIQFFLDSSASNDGNTSFVANFNGVNLFTAAGSYSLAPVNVVFTTVSTLGTLEFSSFNDLSYFIMDSVSVTAVPEPPTIAILMFGVAFLAALGRRAGGRPSRPVHFPQVLRP